MDTVDRKIINALQGGFPVTDRPYMAVAGTLGLSEPELLERLQHLTRKGLLSRFGPMYNAERLGGAVTLAAMAVPADDFDRIAGIVNDHVEIAHNYEREHRLNMWFVIATDDPARIQTVIEAIEHETGLAVYNMPKIEEYFIGLRLEV